MPTFCRHNRFIQNCPICREPEKPRARSAKPSPGRARPGSGSGTATRRSAAGGMRVRRLTRAAEDGYSSPLVPGLRATADAELLADELGFATGRLAELAAAPPGLYADAGSAADRDEGLWLAAQIALLGAQEGDADADAFARLREVVVPWAGGQLPALEGFALGPRSPYPDTAAAVRGLAALRAWIERHGGPAVALSGDAVWSPQRRFERLFERLGTVAGMGRGRYDLLVVAGRLGLVEADAPALLAGDRDDATLAAKRVFGIGDRLLLDRRAAELAEQAELPVAALDLALVNLDRPAGAPRIRLGASEAAADLDAWARAAAALGVA